MWQENPGLWVWLSVDEWSWRGSDDCHRSHYRNFIMSKASGYFNFFSWYTGQSAENRINSKNFKNTKHSDYDRE